ncbi:glycosyltransferase [Nitrospira sp. M1]
MNQKLRIIVTGLIGLYPIGGVAWDYLQYVIGLARLGHDVYYYEDSSCWPYHPLKKTNVPEGIYSTKFIHQLFQHYAPDLQEQWQYVHLREQHFGMGQHTFAEIANSADLFLNISGACKIPDNLSPQCMKVFLDTDPGYNQIVMSERPAWSQNVQQWCETVTAHDTYFTLAENIHAHDCRIPKMGLTWKTTRVPIVLDVWGHLLKRHLPSTSWTTVMTWNPFKGRLMYENVEYHGKGPEFEKVLKLPNRTSLPFTVAVGGGNAPLQQLSDHGWHVVEGESVSRTPEQYQNFIAESLGEFTPAKHVYVAMRSGWFSSRSACYLAAGKPVVTQDTAFSSILPIGTGLLAYANLEEAETAIREVTANYSQHAKAARVIAEEHFDSDIVLTQLIEHALNTSSES